MSETERLQMWVHPDGAVSVYDTRIDWVVKVFTGPDALWSATNFMVKEEY